MNRELSRRDFLKGTLGVVIGGITSEAMIPVKIELNTRVQEITGQQAGNAGMIAEMEKSCEGSENPRVCMQNYTVPIETKTFGILIAPPVEELAFRAVPSLIVSELEDSDDPLADVLWGTENFSITRQEFIAGIASSLLFGVIHNLTPEGFNTKKIPASQTLGGIVYWFLQRKFGVFSNTAAHVWNNVRALL